MNLKEATNIVVAILEKHVDGLKMTEDLLDSTLQELGVDSLDVMMVIIEVGEAAGISIDDDQVESLNTPRKLVQLLEK